jgi:purine-binding chemotaxis protein CheW
MNIADLRKKSRTKAVKTPAAEASPPLAAPSLPVPERAPSFERPSMEVSHLPAAPLIRDGLDELFAVRSHKDADSEEQRLTGAWTSDSAVVEEFRQMLSFSLGSEEYALNIHDIREIIKPREITEVPRVPEFVLGIISLRGIVIPVFDLKRRFKFGASILSPSSRIIVCQRDNKSAGLLVDSITQVVSIPRVSIEPPPPMLSGLERELLEGVGRYRDRMLILLNMSCVLNTDLI